jgi:hypothetical protein
MIVTVYTFDDGPNGLDCADEYRTTDPVEARQYAVRYRRRCWANEYEYSDRDVAFDFSGVPGEEPDEPSMGEITKVTVRTFSKRRVGRITEVSVGDTVISRHFTSGTMREAEESAELVAKTLKAAGLAVELVEVQE